MGDVGMKEDAASVRGSGRDRRTKSQALLPGTKANSKAAVSISRLNLRYGEVEVLRDIDLTVVPGEFLTIIGPSGCGKSTLLNLIGGLLSERAHDVSLSGTVLVEGEEPTSSDLRRGVVFQEYALFPWRTARKNIEFALEARGVDKPERGKEATQYLNLVGLEQFADHYPHQLSGGMKQRVAIARALAYEPTILLMDEPLGALDALTREKLMALVSDVWQRTEKTVVYVTHNVAEAVYLADRVIVLKPRPGEIAADVTIELRRPRDALSQAAVKYERQLRAEIR